MILQALHGYYQRRQADPDPTNRLPAFGLEQREIAFILELDRGGLLKSVTDTRRVVGARKIGTSYLVPMGLKRASGIAANFLWDNSEYALGVPDKRKLEVAEAKGSASEYLKRVAAMHRAFRSRINALSPDVLEDPGIEAVQRFLAGDPRAQLANFPEALNEISSTNPVASFRLIDEADLVCQQARILSSQTPSGAEALEPDETQSGPPEDALQHAPCLITGEVGPIMRLHAPIKGVWNAQTSGANIVSFNLPAFCSYAKSQGANAPVGPAAAFAYTTALNALLSRGSTQRMQVGDASTVFWSEQRHEPMEMELAELLGGAAGADDPDAHSRQVKALFDSVHNGAFDGARGEARFYVLGLAPNAARIAVRFWQAAALSEIAHHVVRWFNDLRMARGPGDPEYPTLFRLLTAVAVQNKADNIPPRLGGDILHSLFAGTPYPANWLHAAVQRCRAERQVTHARAAAIKACLNRGANALDAHPSTREITEMLDTENPSTAYRLGRLFAALERIQEESNRNLNATIRDRYYGAASSSPVAVFTTLMRLKNHHLSKLPKPQCVYLEKLLGEIIAGISDFPAHMNLQDQGRFAIGYYHQRQDFFTKRLDAAPGIDNDQPQGGE